MGLQERRQHRGLGIVAHARGADLVDGEAGRRQLGAGGDLLGARGLEHRHRLLDHVARHRRLVVAVLDVDAQHRHAPGVLLVRVEIAAVLLARQHLAEPGEAEARHRLALHPLLPLGAEPGHGVGLLEHGDALAALVAVAADEALLLVAHVAEARDVDAVGALRELGLGALAQRQVAVGADREDVVHQIAADQAARVGEPLREAILRRREQEARRSERRGRQDHDRRPHPLLLAGLGVEVQHAVGARLRIERHAMHQRVGDQRELAGRRRGRQGRRSGSRSRRR